MNKATGIQLIDSANQGQIMDIKIDPIRNADGKIENGLIIGSTLRQNQALILIAQEGEFKYKPELGIGIEDMILSEAYLQYRHKIRKHFEMDGLRVETLEVYENKPIVIEAYYNN